MVSDRLVAHIPTSDRDLIDVTDIPTDVHSGIARYVFSVMTDVDTRIRWQATYAFVRLALLGEVDTIEAFGAQVARVSDGLFRQQDAPSMIWQGSCGDDSYRSGRLPCAQQRRFTSEGDVGLLNDAAFPHVLIRAFAQAALRKLATAELWFLLDSKGDPKCDQQSLLKHASKVETSNGLGEDKLPTKHHFDSLDTVPYWYRPLVSCSRMFLRINFSHCRQVD